MDRQLLEKVASIISSELYPLAYIYARRLIELDIHLRQRIRDEALVDILLDGLKYKPIEKAIMLQYRG